MATLVLTGISGSSYTFTVYSQDTVFAAVGGVYAITRRYQKPDGNFTHDIIYIGQTSNLSERFDTHHRLDCFNRRNWNCICAFSDADESSRLTRERDLIDAYDPPCNRQ
jgi:hypothetical protein